MSIEAYTVSIEGVGLRKAREVLPLHKALPICVELQQLYQISTDKSAGHRVFISKSLRQRAKQACDPHSRHARQGATFSYISRRYQLSLCMLPWYMCTPHDNARQMSDNNVLPHCMLAVLSLPSLPVDASEC